MQGGRAGLPQSIVWEEQSFSEVRPGIFGATVHTPQLTATQAASLRPQPALSA